MSFIILCDEMISMHKAYTSIVTFRKGTCIIELQAELASFFHKIPFSNESLNDKLCYSYLDI